MEERETGMTKDEMQRYLEQRIEEGDSQLDALKKLMEVLGVKVPGGK